MNLFFFIYQELEFQNYFPIAMEIKNKYKESKITFIFTEKEKYEEIIRSNFINMKFSKKHGSMVSSSKSKICIKNYIAPLIFISNYSLILVSN